jgi:hypothetical protein
LVPRAVEDLPGVDPVELVGGPEGYAGVGRAGTGPEVDLHRPVADDGVLDEDQPVLDA